MVSPTYYSSPSQKQSSRFCLISVRSGVLFSRASLHPDGAPDVKWRHSIAGASVMYVGGRREFSLDVI